MIEYLTRFMGPFGITVLPLIILPALFCSAIVLWICSRRGQYTAIKVGILSSALVCLGFVSISIYDIQTSKSSTAAIGYIFLPFATLLICLASYLISGSIARIVIFFVQRSTAQVTKQSRWPLCIALFIIVSFCAMAFTITSRHMLLNKAATTMENTDLSKQLSRAVQTKDIQLLAAMAKNANAPETALRRIYASIPDSEFQYPGSQYSAVFWELAKNKKTPPDILRSLSEKRAGERFAIAMNPNTPVDVLSDLSEDKNTLVRTWVCSNPNVTKEILMKLTNDPDKVVRLCEYMLGASRFFRIGQCCMRRDCQLCLFLCVLLRLGVLRCKS